MGVWVTSDFLDLLDGLVDDGDGVVVVFDLGVVLPLCLLHVHLELADESLGHEDVVALGLEHLAELLAGGPEHVDVDLVLGLLGLELGDLVAVEVAVGDELLVVLLQVSLLLLDALLDRFRQVVQRVEQPREVHLLHRVLQLRQFQDRLPELAARQLLHESVVEQGLSAN